MYSPAPDPDLEIRAGEEGGGPENVFGLPGLSLV